MSETKVDYKAEQEKSILNVPEIVDFLKQFNLKRVVAGRGHDCGGLIADLYVKSVKYAEFNDDGWGGEPIISWESADKQIKFAQLLKSVSYGTAMFENGWAFMKEAKAIDFDTQVGQLVETLAHLKELEKIQKKCKGRFIYGNDFSTQEVYWKSVKDLKEIPVRHLQKTYDDIKAELKPNQKFFNTDEQLKGLGITI